MCHFTPFRPENILVKNYTKCSVKVIDLGCSIYNSEAHLSHYVQSRSYRAPEVSRWRSRQRRRALGIREEGVWGAPHGCMRSAVQAVL